MQVLTLGLVGAIMCLWFTFDAGVSIFIMLVMFLLVSYVSNRVLLESTPAQYRDSDDAVFDEEDEAEPTDHHHVPLEASSPTSQTQKQPWNVPALRIHELVMDSSAASGVQLGQPLWPNSTEPVSIENEYFSGRILFLLKTEPRSPTWGQLFVGRRRLFWIQLQGKFKKQPKGTVFVGGEIPDKMKLGFFTKGLCRVLLSVINCLVVGLHNSFGRMFPSDVARAMDEELPHLAFPLHSSVDEFICTPPGDKPPPLGSDGFTESREERTKRRSGKHPYEFNTHDTYSFSFFNFYIDFENWKVVNAPGVPDISLSQFWGTMPMRIVSYSLADPTTKTAHTRQQKLYNFCFELTPPHVAGGASASAAASAAAAGHPDAIHPASSSLDVDADEMDFLRDEQKAHTLLANELSCFVFTIPCWLEYFSTHDKAGTGGQRRVAYVFDILEFTDTSRTHLKRHHLAIHGASQAHMPLTLANDHLTRENYADQFDFVVESTSANGARIEAERRTVERRLCEIARDKVMALETLRETSPTTLPIAHMIAAKNQLKRLLTSPSSVVPYAPFFASRGLAPHTIATTQCQVLRMVWDSHWRNEWMILDTGKSKQLRFFRMSSSAPCVSIPLADIVSVSAAVHDVLNLPKASNCNGMHWFEIETLARVHVLAVASYAEYEFWTHALADEMQKLVADGHDKLAAHTLDTPFRSLFGKGRRAANDVFSAPREDGRVVLNDRRITKRFGLTDDVDVCDVAEKALRMAIVLHQHPTVCLTREVLVFLDLVAKLKRVTGDALAKLHTPDRTAFFINLYHVIVLHGSFLELLPAIKTHWSSFYNGLAYDIAGFGFSPAEIEHCMLRATLSPLKPPFPAFVVPKLADDDPRRAFHVPSADYRLDFALNCLTKSCVQSITVYRGVDLELQLNFTARVVLSALMSTDTKRHVIYLPRICEWFVGDFPGSPQVMAMITTLANHLDGEMKQTVETLLSNPAKLSIKYLKYDYGYHSAIFLSEWKSMASNPMSRN
ncbi:Aste57867_18183 [Aphanomyces stellatus]|uniref:Aste57867_18183 protein n=1 Tax=Aphanomyces stellatus TaxID=120398 RepID=A0A485LAT6_9STRA|nr:hypothetical protein As57867_018121 [Aphanomyces stellatus]VFT94921.1 Aste57867_18183 [Aphanomyces stellatus]